MARTSDSRMPPPVVIDCRAAEVDDLLGREWLLTNRLGAYASSSVLGANTRRYHGLLVAAARPPGGRVVTLSCLLDQLLLPGEQRRKTFDLATFEFDGTFSPNARECLTEFRSDVSVAFTYHCEGVRAVKEIVLADEANAVAVRYSTSAGAGLMLRIRPFFALRGYHSLRREGGSSGLVLSRRADGIVVQDRQADGLSVHLTVGEALPEWAMDSSAGRFKVEVQWWRRFRYRGDLARGQEGYEDLYSPGWFEIPLRAGAPVQLTASLAEPVEVDFDAALRQRRQRAAALAGAVGGDLSARRLAMASDAFIARRLAPDGHQRATLMAGYHWFADWGRDAMVALPGLLLTTRQYALALEVLRTFAGAIDAGMVPNCFPEGDGPAGFNSVDASLWFVLAAEAYLRASGDRQTWQEELFPTIEKILDAYRAGTRFGIRADGDGLLASGDQSTQLTWMDVKWEGVPLTPRGGKAVEVNALWHAALRIAAAGAADPRRGAVYGALAERAAAAFVPTFWNDSAGCLFDCVGGDLRDPSIRPNQILAVALPHCPLDKRRQRAVVQVVARELLTPFGLRSLSPRDSRYRGRFGASWESRDKSYHQGSVWAWLMGPFIEAYLRVNDFSAPARGQARRWLEAFDEHLEQAGIGFVSEVFEGDPPHDPGGCIAQAWSVAEVLRAKCLAAEPPAPAGESLPGRPSPRPGR